MRFIKGFLWLLLTLVAAIGLGLAWITSDPEKFKPQLSELIEQRSGLKTSFDGDLNWEIFPALRLSLDNVKADWSDTTTALVEVSNVKLGVALKPLLSTRPKLKVQSVYIDGLAITLAESSTGNNWTPAHYTGAPLPPIPLPIANPGQIIDQAANQTTKENSPNQAQIRPNKNWQIDKLAITNSSVEYHNSENGAYYSLDLATLKIINLSDNAPVGIETEFSFADADTSFTADIGLELILNRQAQVHRIDKLSLQIDENILKGNAVLDVSAIPYLSFTLAADELTFLEIEPAIADEPGLSFTADRSSAVALQNDWDTQLLPDNFNALVNWKGTLDIGSLQVDGEQFGNVTIHTEKRNAKTDLEIELPEFFGGQALIGFDLLSKTHPYRWEVTPDIKNADTQQLSYWLGQKLEWAAPLVLGGTIATDGNTRRALVNNLTANTSFDGQQGRLNIAEIRRQALAVTRYTGGVERVANWPQVLEYQIFTGTWNIQRGGHHMDITLDNLSLKANGKYDPVEDYMDMRIALTIHENPELNTFDVNNTLRELPIPVRCRGSAQAPKCKLDKKGARRLLADALSGDSNDAINEKLNRKIEEEVPEEYRDTARALLQGLGDLLGNKPKKDEQE
jgi:uncharacterized protein involved in outer membrane biogenesis